MTRPPDPRYALSGLQSMQRTTGCRPTLRPPNEVGPAIELPRTIASAAAPTAFPNSLVVPKSRVAEDEKFFFEFLATPWRITAYYFWGGRKRTSSLAHGA